MKPIILTAATTEFAHHFNAALSAELQSRIRVWPHPVDNGALEAVHYGDPAVLVIGPGVIAGVAFGLAERVRAEHPTVGLIVVTRSVPPPGEEPTDSSVAAVITAAATGAEIRAAVVTALEHYERASVPASTVPGAVRKPARVTTVVSPKGGAGKTMVCTNLALGLAAAAPRGVVIVDLDLQFGDVAYALGLKPRHTLFDVISSPGDLDITTLKVFLTHHPSDLYALCAPDDPARGETITVEAVAEIIELLADEFDHVVIDTSAGLTEHTLAAVDLSTDLVLIADMDVPSIRHLTKVIAALDRLRITDHRRHFLLNRADARVGLSMPAAAAKAGLPIDIEIPISKQVPVTVNTGKPMIRSEPKNAVTRRLWDLVARIDAEAAPDKPTGGLLRWSA